MINSGLKIDLTMHGESPVFRRCCFCIPLRRGLIAWGYARLGLNILTIAYLIIIMIWLFQFVNLHYLSSFIAMTAFFMIDVVFTILLVFASHKKSSKLLRISYIYSTAWVIIVLAFGVYVIISDISRIFSTWEYFKSHKFLVMDLLWNCAILFTVVFVQIYVILLTRSEAIKLQNQSLDMQFVNNAAEAEMRCVYVDRQCTDTDNGQDTSVQYTDNKHDNSVQNTDGHDTSVQYS